MECVIFWTGKVGMGGGWRGRRGAEGINIFIFLSPSLPRRHSLGPSRNHPPHFLGDSPKSLWVGGYLLLPERYFFHIQFNNSCTPFKRDKANWRAGPPVPSASYSLSSNHHPSPPLLLSTICPQCSVIVILWILVRNWTKKGIEQQLRSLGNSTLLLIFSGEWRFWFASSASIRNLHPVRPCTFVTRAAVQGHQIQLLESWN